MLISEIYDLFHNSQLCNFDDISLFTCDCVHKDSGGERKANVGNRYRCRYCGHNSTTVILIRDHIMSTHLNYKPYSCLFCDFRTSKGFHMKQHTRFKHPNESHDNCCYSYSFDNTMDSRVKNAYYLVSLGRESASKDPSVKLQCHSVSLGRESATENQSVKLQDHTYNAVSFVASTKRTSSVCQNARFVPILPKDTVQSYGSDNDALRTTVFPKKKKKITVFPKTKKSVDTGTFYRCRLCAFVAASRRSVILHLSKKHGKVKCLYCGVLRRNALEMTLHWCKSHSELPFKYSRIHRDAYIINVRTPPADVSAVANGYLCTSSEVDDNSCNVPGTSVPSDEPDTSVSALTHENSDAVTCGVASTETTSSSSVCHNPRFVPILPKDTFQSCNDELDNTDVNSADNDALKITLMHENGDEVPCGVVDDIIYCCENCPISFSTPEALSLHTCTSGMQQAAL